jgi:hypothetical protein
VAFVVAVGGAQAAARVSVSALVEARRKSRLLTRLWNKKGPGSQEVFRFGWKRAKLGV